MKTVKNMDSMILYIYTTFSYMCKLKTPNVQEHENTEKFRLGNQMPGDTVPYYHKIKVAQKNLIALD